MLTFEHPNIIRLIQFDLINNCADKKYEEPTFHSMIYFVVVTLATVGYGDITPYSQSGRVCVIIFIGVVLVLIPKQTNELMRLMGMQSPYAREVY
jgi:hypothetical protein